MWFSRKQKNRRLGRAQVLDVKLRSSKLRSARLRIVGVGCGIVLGTVLGLYGVFRAGEWALNRLVYENQSFAISKMDVQSDGTISPDQLRRWSRVKVGENLFALDLAHVKRHLELVPMIQSASVERVLPGTLRIRVIEREPIAQVNVACPKAGGGLEFMIFHLDAEAYVMLPLDPRQRSVPLNHADEQLPIISIVNVTDLQPGRRMESPSVHAALKWITAFESSPMGGLVELKRINAMSPDVLVATTAQGSEVTFGMEDFERQMLRWQKIQEECVRLNKVIATLDLAVTENTPLRLVEATPGSSSTPKPPKAQRNRRRNV